MEAEKNLRVFISHSHADDPLARQIVSALRLRGVDVWYDEDSLSAGELLSVVSEELTNRKVFLVLLSPAAVASSWVQEECNFALSLTQRDPSRQIVPIMAAPCDIPIRLSGYKRFDLTRLPYDDAISRLLDNLKSRKAIPWSSTDQSPQPASDATTDSAEPPPSNGGNDFQVTAFHSREARVGTWDNLLLAYAHIASAIDAVRTDADRFRAELGENSKSTRSNTIESIPRGTEITLMPRIDGVHFDPTSVTFIWTEDWHRANFRFRPDSALANDVAKGEIEVYATTPAGLLLISRVRLAMSFWEEPVHPLATDTRTYPIAESAGFCFQSVFASYAHEDVDVVKACSRAYQALGITMRIDYLSLRSGQYLNPAIMQLIESSDIFQLYWSRHSAASGWVRKEWEHALVSNRGEGYIRPVFWEEPMPSAPNELCHIVFARLDREAHMSSTTTRSAYNEGV